MSAWCSKLAINEKGEVCPLLPHAPLPESWTHLVTARLVVESLAACGHITVDGYDDQRRAEELGEMLLAAQRAALALPAPTPPAPPEEGT